LLVYQNRPIVSWSDRDMVRRHVRFDRGGVFRSERLIEALYGRFDSRNLARLIGTGRSRKQE